MFDLKVDPDLPHHYIFSVGIKDMRCKDAGKMFLKHGPIYFSNQDVERVQTAVILKEDKLYRDFYKVTQKQILEIAECSEIVNSITMLKMAAMVNNCSMHHFSTEIEIDNPEKFFVDYVENANKIDSIKEKLYEARTK